jgi:uncharacterized protein (TIGR00255 family)
MTVSSMTGFARAFGETNGAQWAWEIKSVNGRGLDLKFRLPAGLDALELQARQMIIKILQRGSLQIQLSIVRQRTSAAVKINTALIKDIQESLVASGVLQKGALLDLGALLSIRGVIETADQDDSDISELVPALLKGFGEALDDLRRMRSVEGEQLQHIVAERVDAIAALAMRADALPGRKAEAIKSRIALQIATLMKEADFDPARLHQEAILLAAKVDIREELDRLSAHCKAAHDLLTTGGAIGRKLDFLSQEFVREANTLCAKSNDVELTAIGLDLKAIIEQLREQVQNIE